MTYLAGQVPVPNGSTVPVLTVPPGLVNLTVWASTAATFTLGTSSKVSASAGVQLSTIPAGLSQYVSSTGATFWAANTSATSGVFNYVMTTGQ